MMGTKIRAALCLVDDAKTALLSLVNGVVQETIFLDDCASCVLCQPCLSRKINSFAVPNIQTTLSTTIHAIFVAFVMTLFVVISTMVLFLLVHRSIYPFLGE